MAISTPLTWQRNREPGYKGYEAMGPNGVGQALDMAIRHKEAAEEQSMGGGTEFGSPVKKSSAQFDTRFAGDALMGSLNGEFGRVANLGPNGENPTDPKYGNVSRYMQSYLKGMFGPGPGHEEAAPPPPDQKVA